MKFLLRPVISILLLAGGTTSAQIHADFQTSWGDFTCELNYTAAPKTAANFIGLAEGSRAWIDPATGAVQVGRPFYEEITFHRVIAGFMNQAGSPDGSGSDGPGYTFPDETNNGLTHSAAYQLSMANAGPNTNGSQFFITTAPANHLNGKHTVFGSVVTGQEVVQAINQVPTGANSKPVTPVVIHSVHIRRTGDAAAAFDVDAQGLPIVSRPVAPLHVVPGAETRSMVILQPTDRFTATRSENLVDWTPLLDVYVGANEDTQTAGVVLDQASTDHAFYHLARIQSPGALAPSDFADQTLTLPLSGGSLSFKVAAGGEAGITTFTPTSGAALTSAMEVVSFYREPYGFIAIFDSPSLNPRYFRVSGGFDAASPPAITGRHWTQTYGALPNGQQGWSDYANGQFTLAP